MLSIVALKNADAAKSYYERDNYYTKDSPEAITASHWFGKGTKMLGISGYVELEKFEPLLEGTLPNGEQLGRHADGKIKHRPGYDLTFSASKSFSILCEIGRDKRLLKAHDKAVEEALNYIQSNAIKTRVSKNGEINFEKVDNIIAALFRHDTSRELDPNTHTHCVLINAVKRADGQWRSISSETIFDLKMTAGIVYRAKLAELTRKLGYDIEIMHADGRFEIKDISEEMTESFSKRRQKIEKMLREKGWEGGKASATVSQETRRKKQDVDRKLLHEAWREEAKQYDISLDALIEKSEKLAPKIEQKISASRPRFTVAKRSVEHALNHLSEMESVFGEHEIIKESLAFGMGKITLKDVKRAIAFYHEKEVLITVDDERWTTQAAKKLEESNIKLMQSQQETVLPIVSFETVNKFVQANDISYKQGQIEAISLILTTKDRFVGVQGDPGTGKTTMLLAVKTIAEEAGYSVLGLSPTKDAALELEKKANIDSITIHKFLLEQKFRTPKSYDPTSPLLLIVDESSMLGSRQMNELMKVASSQNIRMVFVGDIKQLAAVKAGKPFYLLQKFGLKTAHMREIVRQQAESAIKKAVELVINNNFAEALRYVRMREENNKDKRLQKMAQEYLDFSKQGRENVLVLVPANKDRVIVNQLIREGLKKQNMLSGAETTTYAFINRNLSKAQRLKAINYKIGDWLLFNRIFGNLDIDKREYVEIVAIDKEKNVLTVTKSNGKKMTIKLDQFKNYSSSLFNTYAREERSLMAGDVIRWLRNNGKMVNGHTAKILSVNTESAQIKLQDDSLMTLPLNQNNYAHWDYSFACTVHAAQGKGKPHIIAHMESYNPKLTHQSSLHTIVSRGEFGVTLIVDDKNLCINTIEKHTGQKLSVLEELKQIPSWKDEIHFSNKKNNITQSIEDFQKTVQTQKIEHDRDQKSGFNTSKPHYHQQKYWDIQLIQDRLTEQAGELAYRLFGEPNFHLSNEHQLRYGRKGSLSISASGQYAGTWKNFETGESGNMIQLIQAQGYSFKEALEYAGSFLGLSPEIAEPSRIKKNIEENTKRIVSVEIHTEPDSNDKKAIAKAYKIALESQPIKGTLAEQYLREHRKITCDLNDNYRFHPALYEPDTKQRYPALIAIAKNQNQEIHAVQAIYLDEKTADKADIITKKRTYGRLRFGAAVFSNSFDKENKKFEHIYLAEGTETALSILSANPNAKVAATLSVSNFNHTELESSIKSITVCMDNDGENAPSAKTVRKAAEMYAAKGIRVTISQPTIAKTDFNDVLKKEGIDGLRKALNNVEIVKIDDKSSSIHFTNNLETKELKQSNSLAWEELTSKKTKDKEKSFEISKEEMEL